MIDHTGILVSDYALSRAFYLSALRAIGYELIYEIPASVTGHTDVADLGKRASPISGSAKGHPISHPSTSPFG